MYSYQRLKLTTWLFIFLCTFAFSSVMTVKTEAAVTCVITAPSTIYFGPDYSGAQLGVDFTLSYRCARNSGSLTIKTCYGINPGANEPFQRMLGKGTANGSQLWFSVLDAKLGSAIGSFEPREGILGTANGSLTPVAGGYAFNVSRSPGGVVWSGQSVPAGSYISYSNIVVKANNDSGDCQSGQTATFPITFYVGTLNSCSVKATDIDFGQTRTLSEDLFAEGELEVDCVSGTSYSISLSSSGTGPDKRRMTKGSEYVEYGLYKDKAYTDPWGDTNPVAGVGIGGLQTLPVYARIPKSSATPSAGTYSDTVTVTLNY